ncbi:MAG: hypothetical protein ACI865_000312 [Flavobacteriaceae bacterium]|jgi:hypothetical protein
MVDEVDLTIQTLIKVKYAGSMSDTSNYMNLAMQTGAVLIGGIIMWRMSARFHRKKKNQRERNIYFESTYSKGWKNK